MNLRLKRHNDSHHKWVSLWDGDERIGSCWIVDPTGFSAPQKTRKWAAKSLSGVAFICDFKVAIAYIVATALMKAA